MSLNFLKDPEHQRGQSTGIQGLLDLGVSREVHRKKEGLSHMEVCAWWLRAWLLDAGRHGFKSHLDHVLAG